MLNVDFEGISLKELIDKQMLGWVHHSQHILPQGRCTWFNVHQKPEDDFEVESYEDEDSFQDEVKPESGPPLLSTVAGDRGAFFYNYGVVAIIIDFYVGTVCKIKHPLEVSIWLASIHWFF